MLRMLSRFPHHLCPTASSGRKGSLQRCLLLLQAFQKCKGHAAESNRGNRRHALCCKKPRNSFGYSITLCPTAKQKPIPNGKFLFSLFSASARVYHVPYNMTAFGTETISNMRFERTADAGHKACGASFTPKAHRFPHSADGVVRRSAQARR